MEKEILRFDIETELDRFNSLEREVNETIDLVNSVIVLFSNKTEIAKGSSNRLALLLEQKISLLTRKESIIKNIAELKRNAFNINAKIVDAESGDNDLAMIMKEYTAAIKKQQHELSEVKKQAQQILNEDEVERFFNKHS